MCTVTIIPIEGGCRLVHSRDEQRSRARAVPPVEWVAGPYRLISPRDPDSGGTWIAARDDGLILAVMNVNPEAGGGRSAARSRGLIIPTIAALDPGGVGAALDGGGAEGCAPFRLVLTGGPVGPGLALSWTRHEIGSPIGSVEHTLPACWPTSGLGDSAVSARLPLFGQMVAPDPTPTAQDAFHRHHWTGRGSESVLMSRGDARTVSLSTVESRSGGVEMAYAEVGPERAVGEPGDVGRALKSRL